MLTKHRIKDGVLTLRTAKTGTDVRVPLPPAALDALKAIWLVAKTLSCEASFGLVAVIDNWNVRLIVVVILSICTLLPEYQ